jgi:hypothetical protein
VGLPGARRPVTRTPFSGIRITSKEFLTYYREA